MNLTFCASVAKGSKQKVRKFQRIIPTFVEVTKGKLIGGRGSFCFLLILNMVNNDDPMQILQKIVICGNISLLIALWADIFIAYIALNPISKFFHQLFPGNLANFKVVPPCFLSLHSSFNDSAKMLHFRDGPGCYSSGNISSLTTVPGGIFFPLLLFLQLFRLYFAVTNL